MSKLLEKLVHEPKTPFVAIDFETADYEPDSACAVALIRVENQQIVDRRVTLLKPPRQMIVFTWVHGITWADVECSPTFADAWPDFSGILNGAAFLAAHNASFDRGVLRACCASAGLIPPPQPFACTVQLARKFWRLPANKLHQVCKHLDIPLKHHDAASDAEACARIVLAAAEAMRQIMSDHSLDQSALPASGQR